ncbi:ParA family protein [Syntrophomonas palmitatica]|uniref:ParA family protein n=1 Tax=Syntrophomonas palmitatica TaxID=402877 RepID=UPI0006D1121D|nr:ParA family protein [Syntrophomonas palmitatica]
MGKIIAIANQKGGVGKTTTAINLSACIAGKGKRVLLLDCDPQGNASSGLGINRRSLRYCMYNLLIEGVQASEIIQNTRIKGLDVLPSTIELAGAEVELATAEGRDFALRRGIAAAANEYDYIFMDCPPSLGLLTINALSAADSVLIPLQCEYYALEGLSQLTDTISLVRRRLNAGLTIEGIVFTMFDARTNLSLQVVEEVKKHFRDQVYRTIIPRNVRLSEAPSHGKPIISYDPRSRGAEVYNELAAEVIKRA